MNDKEFLNTEDLWPCWPYLPVKKSMLNVGIVMANNKTKVFLTNLFDRDFENCETKEYSSIDELIADGWVVD